MYDDDDGNRQLNGVESFVSLCLSICFGSILAHARHGVPTQSYNEFIINFPGGKCPSPCETIGDWEQSVLAFPFHDSWTYGGRFAFLYSRISFELKPVQRNRKNFAMETRAFFHVVSYLFSFYFLSPSLLQCKCDVMSMFFALTINSPR